MPHFIGSWCLKSPDICDELIVYFKANKVRQKRGATSSGTSSDFKKSTDITLRPNEIEMSDNTVFTRYFDELFMCYRDYVLQWPFLETFAKNLDIGHFNLQKYGPGEHFQKVHTERSSLDTLHRVFAFMTYLNDVEVSNGGSTFFTHYGIDVQPQKGLTMIWPAEWTHAHKGNVLSSEQKYIITGWLHFPN
ncbi:2OG-Fe(II) oxygenase [bacterium]|nr:2OG-Fe(II) oxygenase [bacterium]